jgi:RNA polymerase sigma-70 factor (sigma-E family)
VDFEEYVASHGQDLLRLAYVLTGDRHRAEDLTQTVLTEAYARWRKVSSSQAPHAYMRKMLVNRNIDWHRRRSSTEQPVSPDLIRQSLSRRPNPDHAVALAERESLRAMVAQLSPRARTVLVLRYYCDLDDASIAKALGIRPGSVRSLASRALEHLRGLSTQDRQDQKELS